MPNKKYRGELTEEGRSRLLDRLGRGKRPAAAQTRVRALLKGDENPEGRSRWRLRLLADERVELGAVETLSHDVENLSHETARQTLKKTGSGRTEGAGGGFRRSKTRTSSRRRKTSGRVDEMPRRLIGEGRRPLPMDAGKPERHDYHYTTTTTSARGE